MKTSLLILILASGLALTAVAATKPHSPSSTAENPTASSKQWNIALCEVHFDAQGNFNSAAMTKSTGSKVLDDKLVKTTSQQFSKAQPNETLPIWMFCKTLEVPSTGGKKSVRVAGSRPPYPYKARASNTQGSGLVQISFNKMGDAISAVMAPSTGSKILDENSVNYVRQRWKSSGGTDVSTIVPVVYQLR